MDTLTPKQRSERMSRVRSKDTKPELAVRRLIHGMGLLYRLHRRNLPGSPDLVFSSRRKVIPVHGCFWHRHLTANLPVFLNRELNFGLQNWRATEHETSKIKACWRASAGNT
jgi:DNA mismatch endonuclease (patch repair protein)